MNRHKDHTAWILLLSTHTWVPKSLDRSRLAIFLSFHPCMHLRDSNGYIGLYLFLSGANFIICLWRSEKSHSHHRNGQYRGECQGKETSAKRGKRITQDQFKVERIGSNWFKVVRWFPISLHSEKIKSACDTRIDTNKGHDDEYRDSDTDTTLQTLDTLYRWSRV